APLGAEPLDDGRAGGDPPGGAGARGVGVAQDPLRLRGAIAAQVVRPAMPDRLKRELGTHSERRSRGGGKRDGVANAIAAAREIRIVARGALHRDVTARSRLVET